MIVVSVVSLKGGVGKTSVVLGLAGAAWQRGVRTLVLDVDPQANATTVLDPGEPAYTMNDVLADPRSGVLADAIVPSGWGDAVDLVASERALQHRNTVERDGALRLRVAMTGVDGYDLVLVDSPPSVGELTKNALSASDAALVVAEPTMFALQGAEQALEAVEVVRASYNLRLYVAGIVVNRVRSHQPEQAFRLAELAEVYGDLVLDPPLPDRSAVQQAAGAYLPIQAWHSPGAREVSDVYDDYLDLLLAAGGAPR